MYIRNALLREAVPGSSGSGDSTPPAFDPAAFEAKLMESFTKMLNGHAKSIEKQLTKLAAPPPAPPPSDPPPEPPPSGNIPPEVNARLVQFERTVKALEAKNAEAEEKAVKAEQARVEGERRSAIKSAISTLPWKDEHSRALFEKSIMGDIVYSEDNELIAHTDKGDMPYADYIKNTAEMTPGLLAPKGSGGAGARSGSTSSNGWVPRITDDFSKYTPEQRKIMESHVLALMAEGQGAH